MNTLAQRMTKLGITEADLEEKFIHGSGPGGQKINKTASCVQLLHLPTGTVVKCQISRSREANRIAARTELCTRLEGRAEAARQKIKDAREKNRRRTRQRSRAQKARMLDAKSRHSQKKQQRRKPPND